MIPEFVKLLEEAKELHIQKNQDYTGKNGPFFNFEVAEYLVRLGIENNCSPMDLVFLTMRGIKLGRFLALRGSNKLPNNESLLDTMKDDFIYSGIHYAYEKEQLKPVEAIKGPEDIQNFYPAPIDERQYI